MTIAFVAGATGFVGRAVVSALIDRNVRTVAHVRLDSPQLARWCQEFEADGAEVDTTPWEAAAMQDTMTNLGPTHVFALLGTTRKRAKAEGVEAREAYRQIDYGLTALLLDAVVAAGVSARFVYLSVAGVREGSSNAYIQARWMAEDAIRGSGVPYTIARPSIITGERDEARPLERAGAVVVDGALAVAGLLGASRTRERFRSTTNDELARGLVRVAFDPASIDCVIESEALHDRWET